MTVEVKRRFTLCRVTGGRGAAAIGRESGIVNLSQFDMMRVWAKLTGLVLAAVFFAQVYFGMKPFEAVPMLVGLIGGFELFLFVQDVWLKRQRSRSG